MKKILFAFALMLAVQISGADVIANHTVNETQLSREEVIQIFLFYKKYWDRSGARIVVILPAPDSILFRKLAAEELNLASSSYYDGLKAKIISAQASPIFVDNEAEMLLKVATIPYSIGYYHNQFKINTGYGIKTVLIQ